MDRASFLSRSSGGILQAKQGNKPRRFEISIYGPPQTSNNDSVLLVGSIPQLGNWTVERGVKAIWQEGRTWRAEVDLPFSVTRFEYKFVVLNNTTNAVLWEQGNNKIWSGIDKVIIAEHWEEEKTALRNLGKMDLVAALSAMRKVQLKETDELKSHHERDLRMKQDVIDGLKKEVQNKSAELVRTKTEHGSAMNTMVEDYEGRLTALKEEYEAKLLSLRKELDPRAALSQDPLEGHNEDIAEHCMKGEDLVEDLATSASTDRVVQSYKNKTENVPRVKNEPKEVKVAAGGISTIASN